METPSGGPDRPKTLGEVRLVDGALILVAIVLMALRVAGEDSKSFRVISALFLSQLVLIIIRDRRLVDTLILVGIAVVELLYFVFGTPPPR